MHASILIPLKGKINMLKEFFIFITFKTSYNRLAKGNASIHFNFISSNQSFHLFRSIFWALFLMSDWTEITQNSNILNEADSVQKAIRAPISWNILLAVYI